MANQWGIPKVVEDEVLSRDKTCVYCGAAFGTDRKSMKSWEHIINDVSLCSPENIALCCIGCNASKGSKLLEDWISSPAAGLARQFKDCICFCQGLRETAQSLFGVFGLQ